MLIVRGVNLFPTAIRSIVQEFTPSVSGMLQIRPTARGVMQDPPLPIHVELGVDADVDKASLKKINRVNDSRAFVGDNCGNSGAIQCATERNL